MTRKGKEEEGKEGEGKRDWRSLVEERNRCNGRRCSAAVKVEGGGNVREQLGVRVMRISM